MIKRENRPLGTNEKVFWVLDQKTTSQFAVVAEIDGNATDHAWRQALDIVQKRHPNLSVQISGNEYSTAHFEHVDDCKIPLRIVYTCRDQDWNGELEKEMRTPFDLSKAPLVRTVLIQQPGKSIFIFLSNHSIGDGMSAALLIRDILSVLSGETISNLPVLSSLDELAGVTVKDIPNDQTSGFTQIKNSLLPRPGIKVQRLELSKALTEKLIKRSKSEKTTVHGTLSAAFVLALKQMDTSWQEKPVRILHPLSARKSFGVADDFNLLINIVTLPYNPGPSDNFWDFARNVREGIAVTQTREWIKGDTNATRELFYNGMDVNTVEQALHQGTEHEILLTNLGRISFTPDFGALKLRSLWGPMVLTPHDASQTIGVATFNEKLTLTLIGFAPSDGLLEAAEKIIDEVCRTTEHIQIGEFFKQSVCDYSNFHENI